jgi:uncharacterized NAD(P)/FAD-binding protein YdhS
MPESLDVAVIGGGASGALVCVQLFRQARGPLRLALVDQEGAFARGAAYGTRSPSHLLNVPAGKMSGLHDQPGHFLSWLKKEAPQAGPSDFARRGRYGAYLQELLQRALREAPRGSRLFRLSARVTGLARRAGGFQVTLRPGAPLRVRAAVLALGVATPAPLRVPDGGLQTSAAFVPRPWGPNALRDLDARRPLLALGTGLTLVDLALTLDDQGHPGPWYALSRHGLLPLPHVSPLPAALDWKPAARGLRGLLREVRQFAEEQMAKGGDWRSVVDALRPHTAALWGNLSLEDQQRFLRHLRAYWDVHRHRMAPEVAARLTELTGDGRLKIIAGRVRRFSRRGRTVQVHYRPRGGGPEQVLEVGRVINCSGPPTALAQAFPLTTRLFRAGLARPDALGLGLGATTEGEVLGRTGHPTPGLFVVGALLRGLRWESVALPEIRDQAAQAAHGVLRHVSANGVKGRKLGRRGARAGGAR